jgi:hypothetical protein
MVSKIVTGNDGTKYLKFRCPGCDCNELIPFEAGSEYKGPIWGYNHNESSPTLTPSVRHFYPAHDGIPEETTCHFHLQNGVFNYCGDCKHNLNGQNNIAMPELKEWETID